VCILLALPTNAKDIVFRFLIEYSSLRDFGKTIFWLVLKLESSYGFIISLKDFASL
jgi:hypothetical protein